MKLFPLKSTSSQRYRQLFWSIIAVYITACFLPLGEVGGFIIGTMLVIIIFLAIRTFPYSSHTKWIFRIIISAAFTSVILEFLILETLASRIFSVATNCIFTLFLSLAIFFLIRQILLSSTVNHDTLLGGISIYLLMGILWFIIYRIILKLDPNAFSIKLDDSSFQLMYFSFTTLTTLGYGDISPVNKIAMGFANIEALIGQLYPAIFIARLVSLYDSNPK